MTPSQPSAKSQPTFFQRISLRRVTLFKRLPAVFWKSPTDQEFIPRAVQGQEKYASLANDFQTLETEVMKEFRQLDGDALDGQNKFRMEQVILILGGALVTALGAVQVTLNTLLHNSLGPGLAEAVIAAVLAGVAQYARSARSQDNYFNNRVKAEALRGEYFRFLGRVGPAYASDQRRVAHLQQRVVKITTGNDQQNSTFRTTKPPDETQQGRSSLTPQEQPFYELYQTYRHQDQLDFYTARQKEFDKAQTQATILTIALMTLTAVVSLLASANLLDFSTGWGILAVIFPILATALSTYQSVYAFERQAKLYKDAAIVLRHVKAYYSPETNAGVSLEEHVEQVESILTSEQGQWGQLISQINVATFTGSTAQGSSGA